MRWTPPPVPPAGQLHHAVVVVEQDVAVHDEADDEVLEPVPNSQAPERRKHSCVPIVLLTDWLATGFYRSAPPSR